MGSKHKELIAKNKELVDKIVRSLRIEIDLKGFKGWRSVLSYKWLAGVVLLIVEQVELVGKQAGMNGQVKEDIFVKVAWELIKDKIGKVTKIPLIGWFIRKKVEKLLRKIVRVVIALLNKILGDDWIRAVPSSMRGDRFNYAGNPPF